MRSLPLHEGQYKLRRQQDRDSTLKISDNLYQTAVRNERTSVFFLNPQISGLIANRPYSSNAILVYDLNVPHRESAATWNT